jgi:hypothetical protein
VQLTDGKVLLGTQYAPIDDMITKFEKEQTQKPPEQHRRR